MYFSPVSSKQEKPYKVPKNFRVEVNELGAKRDINIATNLKIVEWFKAELVDSVAVLFKSLLKAGNEATSDALANIIIITYLMGRRVGVSFQTIDMCLRYKLNTSINEAQEIEQWYGDLSELQRYLESKEKKR